MVVYFSSLPLALRHDIWYQVLFSRTYYDFPFRDFVQLEGVSDAMIRFNIFCTCVEYLTNQGQIPRATAKTVRRRGILGPARVARAGESSTAEISGARAKR